MHDVFRLATNTEGSRSHMIVRKIRNALIAGFCGTVVHSLLILAHSRSGPLPGFQPNEDIQRALSLLVGTEVHPAVVWLLSFVNGAIVFRFRPNVSVPARKQSLAQGHLLRRLRLAGDGTFVLSPCRSRHLRCQARPGHCAGHTHAWDDIGLQRDDEPGL
jgi:hypothetical protein